MANEVQINQALSLTDQLISELDQAERQLSSARNWGFLDVLGGGLITDLIKHSKLNNAKLSMERVNYLLQELKRVLGGISMPGDYSMNVGGFETFADFFFDSGIVDVYMTAKIMSSLNEVRSLKNRCYELRSRLASAR
ncbi:hypothetical protein SAMN04487775_10944 [Treponema bryantii]|uniref:Uncharacterized protein n=1 Tax=Treponema bryantii TaxID=163 RepID=A0A1I3MHL0_9SPIR|nr:hypothetical protein [Treponema bryantii]SFI96489.1 hypothetical protein SAMN04487775_10944 [Treponema bryantii]